MSPTPQTFIINCVLFGVVPNQVFTVEIAQDEKLSALRQSIKKITRMNDIPDDSIELFKISLSEYAYLALDDFKDKLRSAMPREPLEPTVTIGEVYPSGLPEDDEDLHIVAVVPAYALGGADLFRTDEIQEILKELDYKLDSVPLSYPFVAAVSRVADDSETGFLKFIRAESREVSILQHLSAIDSPYNPTVPGIQFWPVRGGHVISMPSAGSPLTDLADPSPRLWSVARQLFEAVAFLHQHGVAHLDLKPDNVLVPPDGGYLSIIDFGAAVRVEGVESMFCGVVGTPGYIPPEIEADLAEFSAIRADLWSCGRTLLDLCSCCWSSIECDILLGIIHDLTDEDPEKRPMMSEVLERMANEDLRADLSE